MALFWLNWEESKWPGHFCPEVPTFFASKIIDKLLSKKKVYWHQRGAARCWVSNCHFFLKNAFFGQNKAFFQKVNFIQKYSVTQNTICQCIRNNFLLSNPKLVFFTEFNLAMMEYTLQPSVETWYIVTDNWWRIYPCRLSLIRTTIRCGIFHTDRAGL